MAADVHTQEKSEFVDQGGLSMESAFPTLNNSIILLNMTTEVVSTA